MVQTFWLATTDGQVVELPQPQPQPRLQPQQQQVAAPTKLDFDEMVRAVTAILAQTRSMSRHDQERIRDVFHAASSLLSAQTRCEVADQQFFEKELRDAISKQHGR
jgi:hypothetical protein